MKLQQVVMVVVVGMLVACGGDGDRGFGSSLTSDKSTDTAATAAYPAAEGGNAISRPAADVHTVTGAAVVPESKVVESATASALRPLVRSNWQRHPVVFAPNQVRLQSDPGDELGGGWNFDYSRLNATITVTTSGPQITVSVKGREEWAGFFTTSGNTDRVSTGNFTGTAAKPVTVWRGNGWGCASVASDLTVHDVTYAGGEIESLLLSFTYQCQNNPAGVALHGQISWSRYDKSMPEPVNPIPADLWKPASDKLPKSGNYIYLTSEANDFIGSGYTNVPHEYLYTQLNSQMIALAGDNRLYVAVDGDQWWTGKFTGMEQLTSFKPGYYPDLGRKITVLGGLDWGGEGRGCSSLWGWYVIDAISYEENALNSIDFRFEQRCLDAAGWTGALRGQIHWRNDDTSKPPGPITPPPMNLWQPSQNTLHATGNYVYLASDPGDFVGKGKNYLYTQKNANLSIEWNNIGNSVNIKSDGNEIWVGYFAVMSSIAELKPGYYGDLQRYGPHNPAKGGMDWFGDGRGCNTLNGWFVVDSVTMVNGVLQALDLRFEQHCEGNAAALRGKIHWRFDDSTPPPLPVYPPPANLWKPAANQIPATGNFAYFESSAGDPVGDGASQLFTSPSTPISVEGGGMGVRLDVVTSPRWIGSFVAMQPAGRIVRGYYGDMHYYIDQRTMFTGGMGIGNTRYACSALNGWFAVDSIERNTDGAVIAIEIRFEQTCDGASAPLRGAIRWRAPPS